MEDALQPPGTVQGIKPNRFLVIGLVVSVILHVACAFFLLGLPGGSPAPPPSVTYIDLNAAQHPAPLAPPPQETPALQPTEAAAQQPPVPETSLQPRQGEDLPAQPVPSQPATAPEVKVEGQRSHTTMGLGLTKGYFKGLGDGETLREGIKGYYLDMLQVINEKWWIDQKLDKHRLAPVVVSITVARNGEIIACEIMRRSGNQRFDKAVLAALAAAGPLPPLPASYDGDYFQVPIRLVPPLNLMAW